MDLEKIAFEEKIIDIASKLLRDGIILEVISLRDGLYDHLIACLGGKIERRGYELGIHFGKPTDFHKLIIRKEPENQFHWCIPWESRPLSRDDEKFLRDIRKRQKERKAVGLRPLLAKEGGSMEIETQTELKAILDGWIKEKAYTRKFYDDFLELLERAYDLGVKNGDK